MKSIYFPRLLCAFLLSVGYVNVSALTSLIETIPRKRLGKKSFLQKQENGKIKKISTSMELQSILLENINRTPGSIKYVKSWRNYLHSSLEAIRNDMSNKIHPPDKIKFEYLFYDLGIAADKGKMPSFDDAGARSGYALEFFCRARNLADIYMDVYSTSLQKYWNDSFMETPMLGSQRLIDDEIDYDQTYNVVSLGGGPGFDFVGTALAIIFSSVVNGKKCREMKTSVFDYEEGWSDLVEAMNTSTRNILQQPQLSCTWGGKCDITKPLFTDPVNAKCLNQLKQSNLVICQYCVAENANLLRESNFIFFQQLFQVVPKGCILIFTETSPHIWPDIYDICDQKIKITFNRHGKQMLLRKCRDDDDVLLDDTDTMLLEKYREIRKCHERKKNSGFSREERKITNFDYLSEHS